MSRSRPKRSSRRKPKVTLGLPGYLGEQEKAYPVGKQKIVRHKLLHSSENAMDSVSRRMSDYNGHYLYEYDTVSEMLTGFCAPLKLDGGFIPLHSVAYIALDSHKSGYKGTTIQCPVWYQQLICTVRRNLFNPTERKTSKQRQLEYFTDDLCCALMMRDGWWGIMSKTILIRKDEERNIIGLPQYLQDVCRIRKKTKTKDISGYMNMSASLASKSKYFKGKMKRPFEAAFIQACKSLGRKDSGTKMYEMIADPKEKSGFKHTRNYKYLFQLTSEPRLLRISRIMVIVVSNMMSLTDYSEIVSVFNSFALRHLAYLFICTSDYLTMKKLNHPSFSIDPQFQKWWNEIRLENDQYMKGRGGVFYPHWKNDLNDDLEENPYDGDFMEFPVTLEAMRILYAREGILSKSEEVVVSCGFWDSDELNLDDIGPDSSAADVIAQNYDLYQLKTERVTIDLDQKFDFIAGLFRVHFGSIAAFFSQAGNTIPLMPKIIQRRNFAKGERSLVRSLHDKIVSSEDEKTLYTRQEFFTTYSMHDSRSNRSRGFCVLSPNAEKYYKAIESDESLKRFLLTGKTLTSLSVDRSRGCECCSVRTKFHRGHCKLCTCVRYETDRWGNCKDCDHNWSQHWPDLSWQHAPHFIVDVELPIFTTTWGHTYIVQ